MATLEGLPIVDAERPLRLHVEKRDINRRAAKNPAHCALAECATRMYKTEARVYMSRAYVKAEDGTHWRRYKVGEVPQREITAFDRGAAFEVGDYYLTPMSPTSRFGQSHPHKGSDASRSRNPRALTLNVRRKAPVSKGTD